MKGSVEGIIGFRERIFLFSGFFFRRFRYLLAMEFRFV